MRRPLFVTVLLAALSLAGCAPKLIPGTDIVDSDESREVIDLMASYTSALEARDIDRILGLVSDSFFETSGTAEGEDDFDKAGLEEKLKTWSTATKGVRSRVQVKKISFEGEQARVAYFFDVSYQVPADGPDGKLVWKNESDAKEMTLRRESGAWRIVSGI
jgi:hypothetical protein